MGLPSAAGLQREPGWAGVVLVLVPDMLELGFLLNVLRDVKEAVRCLVGGS